jgi:hypothetical protein
MSELALLLHEVPVSMGIYLHVAILHGMFSRLLPSRLARETWDGHQANPRETKLYLVPKGQKLPTIEMGVLVCQDQASSRETRTGGNVLFEFGIWTSETGRGYGPWGTARHGSGLPVGIWDDR